MLLGGEPGGGKSNAVNLIVGHGALSADCQLILIDGKQSTRPLAARRRHAHRPLLEDALDALPRSRRS